MTDPIRTEPAVLQRRARIRFVLVAAGVMLVGMVGYAGFVSFADADRSWAPGILVLGATTGFAAFFSPCSFPLLLTFLARRSEESRVSSTLAALRVGLGASVLLALLGVAMVSIGTAFGAVAQFDQPAGRVLRGVVGLLLIFLGLKQSGLVKLQFRWTYRFARVAGSTLSRSKGGDVLYGFGYLLAGFG